MTKSESINTEQFENMIENIISLSKAVRECFDLLSTQLEKIIAVLNKCAAADREQIEKIAKEIDLIALISSLELTAEMVTKFLHSTCMNLANATKNMQIVISFLEEHDMKALAVRLRVAFIENANNIGNEEK